MKKLSVTTCWSTFSKCESTLVVIIPVTKSRSSQTMRLRVTSHVDVSR